MKISRSRFLALARELSELTGLECSVGRANNFIRVHPNVHGCIWLVSINKIDAFCCSYDFLWFVDFNTNYIIIHV